MSVTIFDIAAKAGVSASTVSRALNDSPLVNEETKRKIANLASEMEYYPNVIAQGLRTGKSNFLGFITDDITNLMMLSSLFIRGIENTAYVNGFSVLISDFNRDEKKEKQYLELFRTRKVAGIIFCSSRLRESSHRELQRMNVPFIYLHGFPGDIHADYVVPNNTQGGFIATEHLAKLGRKRIAFIKGKDTFKSSMDRMEGYKQALKKYNLPFDKTLIAGGKSWSKQAGYESTQSFLEIRDRPDAIFCASDMIAAGAIEAIHDSGLSVPHNIAVVGFDDREFAMYLHPPLTTVSLPLYQMGQVATERLLHKIVKSEQDVFQKEIDCELIKRKSCGN